ARPLHPEPERRARPALPPQAPGAQDPLRRAVRHARHPFPRTVGRSTRGLTAAPPLLPLLRERDRRPPDLLASLGSAVVAAADAVAAVRLRGAVVGLRQRAAPGVDGEHEN